MHDRSNRRVLGFDNSHAVKIDKRGRYSGRVFVYDHQHTDADDKGTPYTFSSAGQLIEVFFAAVDRYLKEAGY